MGASASVLKTNPNKRKKSLNIWTNEEKKEIEEAQLVMKKGADFVARHFFYGIPVVVAKQSVDPFSPVWIRADTEKVLQRDIEVDKIEQEWNLIRSAPTTVMVTSKGKVVVIFEKSSVKYDLTIDSISNALERNSDIQTIPLPPFLGGQTETSLALYWELADPPGLVHYVEVQFRRCRPPPEPGCTPLAPYPWQALVSKSWDMLNFLSFTFDNLCPGTSFQFRLRYRNHKGWTEFSEASNPYRTLPGAPSTPRPPCSSAILPHAAHLSWRPPAANGAAIEYYVLEGRAVGEKEFIELFSGMMLTHVVFNLHPEFAYNFRLKAVNKVGESMYSDIYSLQTPAKLYSPLRHGDWRQDILGNADSHIGDEEVLLSQSGYASAQRCADAWRPHYDHKTGQMFYFNVLTGSRQLSIPAAVIQRRQINTSRAPVVVEDDLQQNEGGEVRKDDREVLLEKVSAFRLKRFRFMRDLKKQRQESTGNSPVRPLPPLDVHISQSLEMNATDDSSREDARIAAELHDLAPVATTSTTSVFNMDVDRDSLLVDTFRIVSTFRTGGVGGELRKRLRVTFKGEAGIDVGGLTKEFYLLLSKQMMRYASENYRKWMRTTQSGKLFFNEANSVMISFSETTHDSEEAGKRDAIPKESLNGLKKVNGTAFAHFIGRMIGKALYDQQMVDVPLCGVLLAHMTRRSNGGHGSVGFGDDFVSDNDIQDLDPQLHQSLTWMKNNDITGVLDNTFTVVGPGGNEVILCKDGDKKAVTEENKAEYIKLLIQWKAMFSVSSLLTHFLEGFWELVPLSLVIEHGITAQDIDMMLNGKSSIDVEEIRAYTIFQGEKDFNDNHPQVIMLWQVVREFDESHQRSFLKFVTGTSRVPLDGYDPPFNLTQGTDMLTDSLPRAHTCFNQLVFPTYSCVEMMRERLKFAIEETEGFALS